MQKFSFYMFTKKTQYTNAFNSFIHNSPKLEINCMLTDKWGDKYIVACPLLCGTLEYKSVAKRKKLLMHATHRWFSTALCSVKEARQKGYMLCGPIIMKFQRSQHTETKSRLVVTEARVEVRWWPVKGNEGHFVMIIMFYFMIIEVL